MELSFWLSPFFYRRDWFPFFIESRQLSPKRLTPQVTKAYESL